MDCDRNVDSIPVHHVQIIVIMVADVGLSCRFRDNPLVTGQPFIRFYAGAPLIASNGHRLGSL